MIKIAIIDDQELMTKGLKMILEEVEEFEIVATGSNGYDALNIAKKYYPDIFLMDIKMPKMNGVEATKQLLDLYKDLKIIILTTFNDDEYISKALKYGAKGYLLKESRSEKIIESIKTVYKGGAYIQPEIAIKVVNQFKNISSKDFSKNTFDNFNEKEIKIIYYVSKGLNNKEISKKLYIAKGTVKNYITKILKKTDLRDRTQLAIYGLRNDIEKLDI
ncbi:MAG: response regulator transcription factor [Bacillota bacterium]